jgi:twinkle protein
LSVFDNGNKFCHHCGYKYVEGGENKESMKTYTKPSQSLPEGMTPEVLAMFKERGISQEVLKRNKISFNGREILFPYFQDGEIVNIKYRTLDKKFRQEKDAMKIFYGLDDIKGEKDIYIVEGEFDKLACEVAGHANVTSVPDGAPSPSAETYNTKFEFIDTCEYLFAEAERIIIAVDTDAPGKKLESELIRRFDPAKCWTVRWPDGCKDANEVLIKLGILELMTCLENPVQVPITGVFTVDDYSDSIDELYENGLKGGESTGWFAMDEIYTVRPGEMSIITGIPSHGKSSWLTALIINLAKECAWRFALYSPENQPMQRYMADMAKIHLGKPFRDGPHERMTREELAEAKTWLNDRMYYILPDDDSLGLNDILDKAKATVRRYGITGLIIDPWNEVSHLRPSGMQETEYISNSLSKIRQFARSFMVHVWIVAHPAKMIKLTQDESGKATYPVPTAYDISGSAHWYNKGDNIISVWRDIHNEAKHVQVWVQKVRFREVGKVGCQHFSHDIMTGRYHSEMSQKPAY